jgi:predicted PurR-regulated permease PerM
VCNWKILRTFAKIKILTKQMNNNTNKWFPTVSLLFGIAVLIFLGWYFSSITIYIIISLILTLICMPIKQTLKKIHFKKFNIGDGLASAVSLTIVVGILFGLFALLFVPLTEQIKAISSLESEQLVRFSQGIEQADGFLKKYNILDSDENLEEIIITSTLNYIREINVSSAFNSVFGVIGGLFLGVFSVLFISFVLLKDVSRLTRATVSVLPTERQFKMTQIIERSKTLLSNYFIGLFVEILIMAVLQYIILILLDVPNALLIAVIGGVLVIVPYIGIVIACVLGCAIGVLSTFTTGGDIDTAIIIWKILISVGITRLLDSFFLMPYIASKSVKANPLEIFIVVLVSGYLAGITGMMLGIPAYTVIRIVAKEFFGDNNFVKTFTKSL